MGLPIGRKETNSDVKPSLMSTPDDQPISFLADGEAFAVWARARLLPRPVVLQDGDASPSDFDLNPGSEPCDPLSLQPAAVLVPIIAATPLTVLLTERTQHLPSHAGQIAFPGGKTDPGETSLETALREAHEEIGLNAQFIEPLGYLEPYRTGTGFIVTPVVALINSGYTVVANDDEVADVFEVPLAFLLDSANHRIDSRFWRGAERRFHAMPYQQRYIWGATAGIVRTLHRRLITS